MEYEKRIEFMEKAQAILEEDNRKMRIRMKELEGGLVKMESRERRWTEEREKLERRWTEEREKLERRVKKLELKEEKEKKREGEEVEGRAKNECKKEEEDKKEKEEELVKEKRRMAGEIREKTLKESGIIVKKGKEWEREDNLRRVIKNWIGEREWDFETIGKENNKGWLIFKKKEDKEVLWNKRKEIKEEGKIWMDEWLGIEERRARFKLLKKAAELEETAGKMGVKLEIGKENRYLLIQGRKYGWDEQKEELKELEGGKEL